MKKMLIKLLSFILSEEIKGKKKIKISILKFFKKDYN